jgi:hypothetical protein
MRFLKFILVPFIILTLFVSCGNSDKPMTGLWEFAASGYIADDKYVDCFLNLQADGKYTLFIPDYFDYGTYKQDKKDKKVYKFTSYRQNKYYGSTFEITISRGGEQEKKIVLSLAEQARQHPGFDSAVYDNITEKINREITVKKAAVQFPDTDPYSYNLNRWRIRPGHKESCKEVSYRLINYLRHMHALFEGQGKAGAETANYRYSPSPLVYGANGMASKRIDEIPVYWIYTYYNEEQAKQANNMISAIFDEKIDFPKGTKRYDEMWTKLLSQMITIATQKDFYCNGADSTTAAR